MVAGPCVPLGPTGNFGGTAGPLINITPTYNTSSAYALPRKLVPANPADGAACWCEKYVQV
jgi:hypothetical protein